MSIERPSASAQNFAAASISSVLQSIRTPLMRERCIQFTLEDFGVLRIAEAEFHCGNGLALCPIAARCSFAYCPFAQTGYRLFRTHGYLCARQKTLPVCPEWTES